MDDEQEHLPYARSLAALEREIAHGMETLAYPSADWVVGVPAPDGTTALDCAVIGGGQCGLSVAAGLRRERVMRMEVFDAAPAGREGPWLTFARMAMLRTPKVLTGPDMGMPALSFRAWWEAQYGAEGWEKLFRIPRESWMAYLCWYRRVLDLPVTNGWRLIDLTPTADDKLLRLTFSTPQGHVTRYARTCVLATGAAGSGGFSIPDFVARAVPADRVWHANDTFDLAVMKGQRIGVLGAGASAFDISAAALHAGARSVDLCFRRPALPRTNPRRWMENAGFLGNYVDLPDTLKWRYMLGLRQIGQGPPKPTYDAACALSGFHIHPATPWTHVKWTGQDIVVRSGERQFVFDALVTATGIRVDFSERPELRSLHAHAAFWRDRHAPGADEHCPELGLFPYLDRCGAFTARVAGQAPWLSRVLTATRSCTLSLGPVAASNSALKYVAPRLVDGVRRQLLCDQAAHDWSIFAQRDHTELVAT